MRIRLRMSSTFACTSSRGAEYTATDPSRRRPVSVSRKKSGSATSTIRPSRPDSVAREARPLWTAAATARELEVADVGVRVRVGLHERLGAEAARG